MDFTTFLIAGAVMLLLLVVIFALRGNDVSNAMKVARKTRDIQPVIEAIDGAKGADLASMYNSCIKSFWDSYDRETATKLIHALLERNDSAPISQVWLQTVMDVEPDLARKQLGESFINAHYKAGVAAKCAGCGGSCRKCKS